MIKLYKGLSRKNPYFWVAPACFLLTFLPFGSANTVYGYLSIGAFIFLCFGVIISYVIFLFFDILRTLFQNNIPGFYSYLKIKTKVFRKAIYKFIFCSSEAAYRSCVLIIPVIFAYIVGNFLFNNIPYIGDGIAQYTHARLLAMGLFTVPTHPLPEFFPMVHVMTTGGRWYSQYMLGHLLPLALGHLLGVAYLIDPIICGISALLLYLIAYDNYGKRIARITGALTVLCPQWWYMGSNYMNHNTTLLGVMVFTWAWLRLLNNWGIRYSFLSGYGIALALITRPLTAFAIAFPFGIYGLCRLWRRPVSYWMKVLPAVMIVMAFAGWQLYFNSRTTGGWLVFGPEKIYGDQVKYGFGHLITTENMANYTGTIHTFWRGIGNLSNNLVGLNAFLFNWPIPSLIFVFLGMVFFKPSLITKLMLGSWILLSVIYIPYFYQDWVVGPRYMHEIAGFLIIATAIGIVRAPAVARKFGCHVKRSQMALWLGNTLFYLCIAGVTLFIIGMPRASVLKPEAQHINSQFPDQSLVFANKTYEQLTVYMPPLDNNRVIYAKDLGPENYKLMDYYPQRTVFLETEGGFKKIRDKLPE